MGNAFPLNGTQISFLASLIAIGVYVLISLLTHKQDFNLDRMLHRGEFAVESPEAVQRKAPRLWERMIGVDENFNRLDKWIATGLFAWCLFWVGVLVVGTVWNLVAPWPTGWWSAYWKIAGISVPVGITVVTGVWFTWGGVRDIKALFRRLSVHRVNHLDDGTVVGHTNLDETKKP
jgi:SSS family solute:Na+ symporter